MTDRELLERAAKAAGLFVVGSAPKYIAQGCNEHALIVRNGRGGDSVFDPITDDGDSARLEAALQMSVEWNDAPQNVYVGTDEIGYYEPYGSDRQAARRRAGVRAAAAMVPA